MSRFARQSRFAARAVAAGVLVWAASAPGALAQTSRTDERARRQAEKAARLAAPERSRAERLVGHVETLFVEGSAGLYPWVGSVMGGGWLATGAQYSRPLGDTGRLTVLGAWSLRNYRMLRGAARLPALLDRRLVVQLGASAIDANKVAFYGLGPRSTRHDRASYRIRPVEADVAVTWRLAGPVSAGASVGALSMTTGDGALSPTVSDVFDASSAPGLGARPRYIVTRGFAAVDWRDGPGYSRRGGLYRVEWTRFAERARDRDDVDRTAIEVQQLVPILRGHWVIAVRGLGVFTRPAAGGTVPYFLMPALGGSATLRGLPNHRLRDRHLLLVQAEYRWTPSRFLDMALFVDAGTVAHERRALSRRDMRTSYGVGVRFHSSTAVVLRTDVAWSREGVRVIVGSTSGF